MCIHTEGVVGVGELFVKSLASYPEEYKDRNAALNSRLESVKGVWLMGRYVWKGIEE